MVSASFDGVISFFKRFFHSLELVLKRLRLSRQLLVGCAIVFVVAVISSVVIGLQNDPHTERIHNIDVRKSNVKEEYLHDSACFTEGLLFTRYNANEQQIQSSNTDSTPILLESCGLKGKSYIQKFPLTSKSSQSHADDGTPTFLPLLRQSFPQKYFIEGIAEVDSSTILCLTYRSKEILQVDHQTLVLNPQNTVPFDTESLPSWQEGWGLTFSPENYELYLTDGTARNGIIVLDPATLKVKRNFPVSCSEDGAPLSYLNELEYFAVSNTKGLLLVNIWQTATIAVISLETRACVATLSLAKDDFMELLTSGPEHGLNGIARHPNYNEDFVVTGKNWPTLLHLTGISLSSLMNNRNGVLSDPQPTSAYLSFLSGLCGVIYTVAWIISFWAQLILNLRRKSVDGMSLDLAIYNIVGYAAYSTYTILQYSIQRTHGSVNAVEINDIGFAVHSLVLCTLIGIQCLVYPRGNQKVGAFVKLIIGGFFGLLIVQAILAAVGVIPWMTTLRHIKIGASEEVSSFMGFLKSWSFIVYLGYFKSLTTMLKYAPQIVLNYRRKTTEGSSMDFYIFDVIGGTFSLLQNCIGAVNYRTMEYLFGNIPKLVIALTSLIYDFIILTQRYLIYPRNHPSSSVGGIKEKQKHQYEKMNDSAVDSLEMQDFDEIFESSSAERMYNGGSLPVKMKERMTDSTSMPTPDSPVKTFDFAVSPDFELEEEGIADERGSDEEIVKRLRGLQNFWL